MKKQFLLLLLFLLVPLFQLLAIPIASYASDSNVLLLKDQLSKLDLKDPESDAKNDLFLGKSHFIGLYGFSTYFPGVANDDLHYIKEMGAYYLKGTSDAIEGKEHEQLIEQAKKYAKRYNEILLSTLKHRPLLRWPAVIASLRLYENYPSAENALKVDRLLPFKQIAYDHSPSEEEGIKELENIFPMLARQIRAQDRTSIRLAFHLYMLTDGALSETLDMTLGELIRINPRLFLEELKTSAKFITSLGHLVGNIGTEYVDHPEAQCLERKSRIQALKSVNELPLNKLKGQCIDSLEKDIKAFCHK